MLRGSLKSNFANKINLTKKYKYMSFSDFKSEQKVANKYNIITEISLKR